MHYRPFGRTNLQISEIGHGTWTMGSHWGARDDGAAVASLVRSIESGVNFIDTAAVYGDGHSEELIAAAFKRTRQKVFVATKVPPQNYQWPARHDVPVEQAFSPEHVIECTEKSLKNLRMECVDLQQLHVWSDNWLKNPIWLEAVEKLKTQGKIRFFGVSINDHEPDSALKIVESGLIDSVQVIYNIFDQTPEQNLFPACQKHNVAVIVRVPFDEGSLTGTLTPDYQFHKNDWRKKYFTPERLKETCERIEKIKPLLGGRNLSQLALEFCLSHPAVSTVIPGMRKIEHVEENCRASTGKPLSTDLLNSLRQHAWPRNFYPVWS